MPETLFEEIKRYVTFGQADEDALRAAHPLVEPEFQRIADIFYQRILEHDGARKALEGGGAQIDHLKVSLKRWLDTLLKGPWDEAYFDLRCRIGRAHVRIELPQHYMFGAMNVLRQEVFNVIDAQYADRTAERRAAKAALGKILDLELAVMLHTYREDLLTQQARHERLSTFGQLVGSIGHELRNPLGVIETSLFILRGRMGDDERVQKHVNRIAEQITLANTIISDLLDMIRDRPLVKDTISLAELIQSSVSWVPRLPEVALRVEGMEALPSVRGDRGQLRQVFVNLVENAVQAAGQRGEVRIAGSEMAGFVRIAVEDTGQGVDEAIRRRLFEPLITTKEKGIGLGLALVKRVIDRHEGIVSYEPRPEGGARFIVRLPVARS